MAAADTREQLAWESENGPRFAAASFASAALVIAGFVMPAVLVGDAGDDERDGLIAIHDHAGALFATAVVQGLAFAFLCGSFYYLTRAIGARAGANLKTFWPVLIAAPVLLLVGSLIKQANLADIADTFVSGGAQTVDRAKDLADDRGKTGDIVAAVGTLALAASFVLVGVHGMRTGLFSKFMGAVGILSGALLIIPILPAGGFPILPFWVFALGFLLLDRWPQGRGPAWSSGQSIPWPSAAEIRDRQQDGDDAPPPSPAAPASEPRPAGRKRKKRKR